VQDRPGRSRHQSRNSIFSSFISTVFPLAHLPNSLDPFNILLNRLKIIFDDAEISADGIKPKVRVAADLSAHHLLAVSRQLPMGRETRKRLSGDQLDSLISTPFQSLAQSIARVRKS
jgi:hypothetical protein